MSTTERFVNWWSDRLHLKDIPLSRIPNYMYSVNYWLGSMVAAAFFWEVISGLFVILYYEPSDPYGSTMNIIHKVPYGQLLLGTHLYGAYLMILLAYIHMFRNYFVKAYKKPRELQWMIGVILLTVVQGAAFLGYSMTGDILASDAVDVGRGIMGSLPLGKALEPLVFGNGTSLDLFSRLLGYHIILVALIGILFGYHFYLAEMNGFMPSHRSANYRAPAVLDQKDPSMNPWYPRNLIYMLELVLFTFGIIVIVPSILMLLPKVPILFSPYPSVSPTSALAKTIPAYPPWFFLFMYKVLDFKPLSPLDVTIVAAVIPILYFLLVPILDRSDDLHFMNNWVFQAIGIIAIINFIQASVWAALAPGVPVSPSVYVPIIAEPFVVVLAGFYLMSRSSRPPSVSKIATLFLLAALVGIFAVTLTSYSHLSSLQSLPAAVTGTLASGFFGAVLISANDSAPTPATVAESTARPRLGAAFTLLTILVVTALVVAAVMWTYNPITQAPFFGLGLGALLLIFAEMIAIYHYAVYTHR